MNDQRLALGWLVFGAIMLVTWNVRAQAPTDAPNTTVRGEVVSQVDGKPIAKATVRALFPADDMRHRRTKTDAAVVEAVTDERGQFSLGLALPAGLQEISLDVLCPGYRSLAGPSYGGFTYPEGALYVKYGGRYAHVARGETLTVRLKIPPALYVEGRVIDENGKPAEDVVLTARLRGDKSYLDVTSLCTDKNGRFAIYDFPLDRPRRRGEITFWHSELVGTRIADVYAVDKNELPQLVVRLGKGRAIAGRAVGDDGAPLPGALVQVTYGDTLLRKATQTDAQGAFVLKGLAQGRATLFVSDFRRLQFASQSFDVQNDEASRVVLAAKHDWPSRRTVLRMTVVDVTTDVERLLGYSLGAGVLVIESSREDVLAGDIILRVSEDPIRNVKDFLNALRKSLSFKKKPAKVPLFLGRLSVDGVLPCEVDLRLDAEDVKNLNDAVDP